MTWYDALRVVVYAVSVLIIMLTIKLLLTRRRWRHPLRGNGPMLCALLVSLAATELARARNIGQAPPPYLPSLIAVLVETLLILWWLWSQLELIPRWVRQHLSRRRARRSDDQEDPMFTSGDRVVLGREGAPTGTVQGAEWDGKVYVKLDSGSAGTFATAELSRETKAWPPEGIETK